MSSLRRFATTGLLAAALAVAGFAAVPAAADEETAGTRDIEERVSEVDGVAEAEVRYAGDWSDTPLLVVRVTLTGGAEHLPPVLDAIDRATAASEHADEDLMARVSWTTDGLRREMVVHDDAGETMLRAAATEAPTMQRLEHYGLDHMTVSIGRSSQAQYIRSIEMALPPGTPGRAYVRLYEALRTQLPDDGAATTFEVRTRDADGAPRHDRTFSATSVSEPELLASADAVLRSPVPEGDGIAYRVGVDLSGHRPGVDGQYQSMNLVLRPAGDESVEELLDSPEILERGHHLAETMAAPVRSFLRLRVEQDHASEEAGYFFSADCTSAWEDESGRSRALWQTWVEAGGEPEDGATATDCPHA